MAAKGSLNFIQKDSPKASRKLTKLNRVEIRPNRTAAHARNAQERSIFQNTALLCKKTTPGAERLK